MAGRSRRGLSWAGAGGLGTLAVLAACSGPSNEALSSGHTAPSPTPTITAAAGIVVQRRLSFSDVAGVARATDGLYVLRGTPFPGDATGEGWQVDLIDPESGAVLRQSAIGDASPVSMVVAFGSLWVLTSPGAMPGGLGYGIDRLDAMTLAHQERITLSSGADGMGATASTLWVLQSDRLAGIDPATNLVTRTVRFNASEDVESLSTTPNRVVIASMTNRPSRRAPNRPLQILLTWIDDATLKVVSTVAVTRSSAARATPPTLDVAALNDNTAFLGLFSVRNGDSLAVVRGHTVIGRRQGVGGTVVVSPDDSIWAIDNVPAPKGAATAYISEVQKLSSYGTVTMRRHGLGLVTVVGVVGRGLYVRAGDEVIVLASD
jgi:hypothetical protein